MQITNKAIHTLPSILFVSFLLRKYKTILAGIPTIGNIIKEPNIINPQPPLNSNNIILKSDLTKKSYHK